MGFLVGHSCYDNVQQAADVWLASNGPMWETGLRKFVYVSSPTVTASGVNFVLKDDAGGVIRPAASVLFMQTDCTAYPLTLERVFDMPLASDFEAAWAVGFILPMTCALVAYCIARVVSMFDN